MNPLLRVTLALVLIGTFALPCSAEVQDWINRKRHKILFLGDSNTFAGLYISYLEGYLRTRFSDEPWELINLGLPSETLSGLSEPDHPYPRPNIHERADRALAKVKPSIVFICYGMNDGIYYPFSEERLKKYKEGTEKLVDKIENAGATVILITPSPFDGVPMARNLLPKDSLKFSWMKPYENYDAEVLRKYSDYLLEWRKKDYLVVDAHAAVHRFLKAMRAKNPNYTVSGDGIHPNPTGHAIIAFEILRELKVPREADRVEINFAAGKAVKGNGGAYEVMRDSLKVRFTGRWPMPTDPRWHMQLDDAERFQERFRKFTLVISGMPPGKYEINGEKPSQVIGSATAAEFAKGIDIARFKNLAIFAGNDKLGATIQERQRKSGLAWLTEIGHKRPDTPKGARFDEAMAADEKDRSELLDLLRQRNRGQLQGLHIRRID